MNDLLKLKIEKLPTCPGCYLMKSEGKIIYVGKAVNLKTASASILPTPRRTRSRCAQWSPGSMILILCSAIRTSKR